MPARRTVGHDEFSSNSEQQLEAMSAFSNCVSAAAHARFRRCSWCSLWFVGVIGSTSCVVFCSMMSTKLVEARTLSKTTSGHTLNLASLDNNAVEVAHSYPWRLQSAKNQLDKHRDGVEEDQWHCKQEMRL